MTSTSSSSNTPNYFRTQLSKYPHLVAGSTAGITSTLILHPLDLVKTRFQVNEGIKTSSRSGVPSYTSTYNAFRTIASKEGIRALYQGVPTAMLGSGVSWGLYFFLYERAKLQYQKDPTSKEKLPPWAHMLAGTQAGAMTVMVTNPIWLIKTRLQLQVSDAEKSRLKLASGSTPKYRGFIHAVRTIVSTEGPLALYRGVLPALFLTSHGALQFVIYEELKAWTIEIQGELGTLTPMLIGAASKVCASSATYPYQVIKARIQRLTLEGEVPYKGIVDCARRTFQQEGVLGFYKGLAPNLIRIAPSAGITFFMYENISSLLRK